MLKKSCGIAFLVAASSFCSVASASPWYATIGTGYAFSQKIGTTNPDSAFWDNANEGYDSKIGNAPFYKLGFGRALTDYLNADLSFTSFSTFNYQKNQTGSSNTPGFTGNLRTRFYDLDNQNIMINFMLHPYSQKLTLQVGSMNVAPFIGAGAGLGMNKVSNFHTVSGYGVDTSIGSPTTTNAFAWQGSVGLTLHPENSQLFCDLGYKYYDGGKYNSPVDIIDNVGSTGILIGKPWVGRLKTNQIFADLRIVF